METWLLSLSTVAGIAKYKLYAGASRLPAVATESRLYRRRALGASHSDGTDSPASQEAGFFCFPVAPPSAAAAFKRPASSRFNNSVSSTRSDRTYPTSAAAAALSGLLQSNPGSDDSFVHGSEMNRALDPHGTPTASPDRTCVAGDRR